MFTKSFIIFFLNEIKKTGTQRSEKRVAKKTNQPYYCYERLMQRLKYQMFVSLSPGPLSLSPSPHLTHSHTHRFPRARRKEQPARSLGNTSYSINSEQFLHKLIYPQLSSSFPARRHAFIGPQQGRASPSRRPRLQEEQRKGDGRGTGRERDGK